MRIEKNPYYKTKNVVSVKTVGLIINPVAGMGGAVGLKGTDGKAILNRAKALGAQPIAQTRAKSFLSELEPIKKRLRFFVGGENMGENAVRSCGFTYKVIGKIKKETTAEDTKDVAKRIRESNACLLVFCGGDGTARDIQSVVNAHLPVLGVPTGVKMHSAVFAVDPRAAARVTIEFLNGGLVLKEAEIMDVDEKAFREGSVSAALYGYVLTPYESCLIQRNKVASLMVENEIQNQVAIAIYVIENMKRDVIYIIGPGTTTRTIGNLLDTKKTLLGVDLFCNKKILAADVNEKQILEKSRGKLAKIIVTPIGGQGFILGRGNQQISPEVIRQVGLNNIIVIATESKLRNLKSLKVDTGDSSLDDAFREHNLKVIKNYNIGCVMRVE